MGRDRRGLREDHREHATHPVRGPRQSRLATPRGRYGNLAVRCDGTQLRPAMMGRDMRGITWIWNDRALFVECDGKRAYVGQLTGIRSVKERWPMLEITTDHGEYGYNLEDGGLVPREENPDVVQLPRD